MIWRIAQKELLETIRDGRFVWTGVVVFVLFITAIGVGAQRYSEDRALRQVAEQEDRELWLNQGDKGPHSAGHYGVYAFKPATPLAFFDPGFNDYTGTLQYLEAHRENQASYKPATDATALQRFGDLSGAMVLQLLTPLLIFLLCFGMIAGEREDGTLRQLMSMGVPKMKLVWGKAAGAGLALGVVLIPCIFVSAVLAALFIQGDGDPHTMVDFPAKLAVIVLVYLVFFASLAALALSVSIRARSSAAALTALIGFWIVAGLLIPRMSADVSKLMYDTPSAFELADTIQKGREAGPRAHEPNHPNHIAFKKKVLEEYGVDDVDDLPFSFVGLAFQADEELGFKVFDETFGGIRRTFEKQNRVRQFFGLFSPFVAVKTLSSALSGTDVHYANDFSKAGESYRRNMVTILNEDIKQNATGMTQYSAEWGYRANKSLWEKVPPFDFDPPGIQTILGRNMFSIFVLFLWLTGGFGLLYMSAKRVDSQL